MRCLIALLLAGMLLSGCRTPGVSKAVDTSPEALLFAQALKADGADYVSIRSKIIARKAEALPFLRSKISDPDWHVRVVAQIMIAHIEDPQTYARYEEKMMTIRRGIMHRGAPSFYDDAYGAPFAPGPDSKAKIRLADARRQYSETSAIWFLAETALMRSVSCKPVRVMSLPNADPDTLYSSDEIAQMLNVSLKTVESWMNRLIRIQRIPGVGVRAKLRDVRSFAEGYLRPDCSIYYQEAVRLRAMLTLSSFADNPTVIPLLRELLESRESTKIRGYAAIALGQSGDARAIIPLWRARNDSNKQVKEAAGKSLKRLYEIMQEPD